MIKRLYLFIALLILVLASCKTAQKAEPIHKIGVPDTTAKSSIKGNNDTNTIISITQNNSWYSARANLTLTNSNDEISAFIVNRRDSLLYININKFGIEIARAVFTPDTISIINRFEKTYYKGDYSIITRLYGFSLTFNMLQAIILGESFRDFKPISKSVMQTDTTFVISTPRSVDAISKTAINQVIVLDKLGKVILKNWVKDIATQQVVTINYSKYQIIDGYNFPEIYSIELPNTTVQIDIKNSKVNVPGPTSLTIPAKYTLMFP